MDAGQPPQEGQEQPPQEGQGEDQSSPQPEKQSQTINLPEPNEDEIKKYDLELQDYEYEQDYEDIDYSVGDE